MSKKLCRQTWLLAQIALLREGRASEIDTDGIADQLEAVLAMRNRETFDAALSVLSFSKIAQDAAIPELNSMVAEMLRSAKADLKDKVAGFYPGDVLPAEIEAAAITASEEIEDHPRITSAPKIVRPLRMAS